MLVIDKYYPEWRNLDIHESSPSGGKASLKLRKNAKKYMASQYYPGERSGAQITYYQNQDLENQTFKDESFDLVITQDVMEHVFNPAKAFSEIARTLKKGGAHVFTVPLVNKHRASEVWAVKGENNQPVFLKTPEWHGNPINAKGSPVTMHWGYDIAGFIKENSGLETIIEYIDNLDYGIRAEFNEVVISRKQCSM